MEVAATLLSVLEKYGVLAVCAALLGLAVVFFIKRNLKREDALQKQLNDLNKEVREAMVPVMVQCKDVMVGCRDAITQNSQVILRLIGDTNK